MKMESSYKIDKERKMIFTKFTGEVSIEGLLSFENKLLEDSSFEPGLNAFVDFSEAELTNNVDINKIKMGIDHIESIQKKRGKCKWAIYAPHDYLYTFWLIFEGLADNLDIKVKVFKDRDEAQNWVGISAVSSFYRLLSTQRINHSYGRTRTQNNDSTDL